METDTRELFYCDLGLIDYKDAWDLQKSTLELRHNKKLPDIIFLLEHPHTYTLGKVADKKNLIGSEDYLTKNKISVYDIDRGGDITYHGPGQIVGYPIIDLTEWESDTHKYLRALEEVIIRTCAYYGVKGTREPKYTGVWIEDRKIAAIGIKVSRWITMHGFAFNVNTDLSLFSGIIPCGISDKEVTSLQKETGREIDMQEVKSLLVKNFKEVFNYNAAAAYQKEELIALNLSNS
ncbi:MAG: lipoyl(octanoyl) transferase LipB [Ignavibacteriaceae bacterium]|nr:lipoyl(octanoyl) transferase LipB [Ignavibacteriaceae bacterium]